MFTSATSLAVLGLATLGVAHINMIKPVPYGVSTLNNSPLDATGADFPCKQRTGVYSLEGANNVMALGSSQPLNFKGSAVHGGGSCQISITYDQAPTKNSVFKVIHTIEGGCPMKNIAGNQAVSSADEPIPDTYNFKLPDNIPTGNATLAWTWFNKIGNREMYMNCAPVTLTGSSSKREIEERDTAAFNALPDMFVANIGNGCTTQDSTDLALPNPGASLEQFGLATAKPSPPTGTCPTAVAAVAGTSGASSAAPAATSPPAKSSSPAVTLSGGVFETESAGTSATASPATTSTIASPATTSASVASASIATSTSSAASPAGTTSAFPVGQVCVSEGMWNCVAGTQFQRCASGVWSALQSVAAGTTCTPGESSNIVIAAIASKDKVRRAVRFSSAHVRRHAYGF